MLLRLKDVWPWHRSRIINQLLSAARAVISTGPANAAPSAIILLQNSRGSAKVKTGLGWKKILQVKSFVCGHELAGAEYRGGQVNSTASYGRDRNGNEGGKMNGE